MKQENIKKVMEQIRSKKNVANELVATAEAFLNATNEVSEASYTPDFSNDYVAMTGLAYSQTWNEILTYDTLIGTAYGSYLLVTQVEVNIAQACSSLSVSTNSLTEFYLKLSGNESTITSCEVYDENVSYRGTVQKVGDLYQIPLSLLKTGNTFPDTVTFYLSAPEANTSETLTYADVIPVVPAVLSRINVTTAPTKTTYLEGDKFDKTGMVVTATYSNNTTKTVTDYTYSPSGALTTNNTSITISYTEGGVTKTTTQAITVTALGQEGYYGNRNISVSNYGKNPIWNLQTMGLRYLQSGLSIGMNSYTIGANLVYDSQMKERLQDLCVGMPNGWKLDAHQFIVKDGKDNNNNDMYKYVDGQGYVHAFEMYLSSDTDTDPNLEYYDTEGAGLVLTVSSSYVIKDKNNNVMHFDANGRLIKTVSGTAPSNIKHYEYDSNGRLTTIYDNRKSTRCVSFEYSNNILAFIKTKEGESVFETLTISCPNGNITEIKKMKNSANEEKTINVFTYDANGKLQLMADKETNNAVKAQYSLDEEITDHYLLSRMSYGYVNANNVFTEKTFEQCYSANKTNNDKAYCQVVLRNEKGIKIVHKTDSEGNITESLEMYPDDESFRTLNKDVGVKLEPEYTIAMEGGSVNDEWGCVFLENDSGYSQISIFEDETVKEALKGYRYWTLSFWMYYSSWNNEDNEKKSYIEVSYFVGEKSYTVYKEIDFKLINVGQKIEIPLDLQDDLGALGDMSIKFVRFTEESTVEYLGIAGSVCCFRMNPRTNSTLKLGENNFEDITKMIATVNGVSTTIKPKTDDVKFTENDFIRSVESYNLKQKNGATHWDFYYDNGKKRIRYCAFVMIYIGGTSYNFLTLASQTKPNDGENYLWWIETHSADNRVVSKQYPVYNETGCLTITKTKIGDGEESTTENQAHYQTWDKEITDDTYGVKTVKEYFDDGNLKKETLSASDNSQIIVYEAARDEATGEYITQETGSFDTKTYTYLDFALDKLERSGYNGNTYRETYEYDAYREQLEKLTAYEDSANVESDTPKAQNVMTYEEGELSTATDSKSKYKFDYDKATDTSTFGVYQGTTLKTLEKQVLNASENTVTHTYYRNNSTTPSDTFVYTLDYYGRILKESYNGTDMVTYGYTNGAESPIAQKLASVVDGYNGKVYGYGYYADGTLGVENVNRVNVVDATTGEIELVEEFKAERLNESSKKYTIGTDTLKQTATQDTRLKKLENAFNDTVVNVFSKEYEYDKFGRMTGKKLPNNASVLTLGYADTHMLPVSETYKRGSTTEYTATYGYDGRGNITSVTSTNGTTSYEYDTLNRLKKEINGESGFTYEMTYGNDGRISTVSMTGVGTRTFSYDDCGRLEAAYFDGNTALGNSLSYLVVYDDYGNRTWKVTYYEGQQVHAYTWTRGRLLASVNSAQYTYDRSGKRTKKVANGVTHEYFYDGDRLITEKRGNTYLHFFYDEGGVCGMCYNGKNYEFVRNLFGDVIRIYDGNTLVARYSYDCLGNCTVHTNVNSIATVNPFRYRGYYYDVESGLYYLMSRYYDPTVSQFLSPDTQDYLAPDTIGGVDLYAYCGNNPVMYADPSGHFAISTLAWIIIGAAVLTTAGVITYGAVTDTPIVLDFSVSAGMGAGVGGKAGISIVLDFKNDSIGFYPHYGYYYGAKYNTFGFSYGIGLISNYENEGDYAGPFVDFGGGFYGGIDHCYDPRYPYDDTVRASSIIFGNNKGIYYGYDYYGYWGSISFN